MPKLSPNADILCPSCETLRLGRTLILAIVSYRPVFTAIHALDQLAG